MVQMKMVNAQAQRQAPGDSGCDPCSCGHAGLGPPRVGAPLCATLLSLPPSHHRLCEPFPPGAWSRGHDLPQGRGLVLSTEVPGPRARLLPLAPRSVSGDRLASRPHLELSDSTAFNRMFFFAKNPYFLPSSLKPIPFLRFPLRLPLDLICFVLVALRPC